MWSLSICGSGLGGSDLMAYATEKASVVFTPMQMEALKRARIAEGRRQSEYIRRATVKELIRLEFYNPTLDPDNNEGSFDDGRGE